MKEVTLVLTVLILLSMGHAFHRPAADQAQGKSTASSLREDFENTPFPPVGWTTETAGLGLPFAWHRTTDPDYGGSGKASARVGGESPRHIDEWLISPSVSLVPGDHAIKFLWSGNQNWSQAVDASLNVRESGDSVWTQLWSLADDEPPADPFIYRKRVVDLTSWIGRSVQFGFRVAGKDGASFSIDDIAVGDFDPTAAPPNDTCEKATALDDTFCIQGVTCYAKNDLGPYKLPPAPCIFSSLDGPDVFFRVTVNAGDSLHAAVTALWCPGIYVVDDCVTPRCIVGGYAVDGATHPIVNYRFGTGGTYYVVVDGEDGSCGPYELNGTIISSGTK